MSPAPTLPDNKQSNWLHLARPQNVGPVAFAPLLKRYGGPAAALNTLPEIARGADGAVRSTPSIDAVDAEIEATRADDARILASGEANVPPHLRTLSSRNRATARSRKASPPGSSKPSHPTRC